jgi:hypothetical protein
LNMLIGSSFTRSHCMDSTSLRGGGALSTSEIRAAVVTNEVHRETIHNSRVSIRDLWQPDGNTIFWH